MNKKSKIFTVIVLLILTTAGWSIYKLYKERQDAPPSIESFQKTLQGNIKIEDRYYTWEEKDLIEKPMIEIETDKDITDLTEGQEIEAEIDEVQLASEPLTNYIYFEKDVSVKEIFDKIVPTEKGGIYFLVFNPEKDMCVSGEEGFVTFKEPDSTNTIKAYCTIILYTKEETSIFDAKSSDDGISAEQYENILDSFGSKIDKDIWVLTPIPSNKEDFKSIEDINIAILDDPKDQDFKSVATDYEEIEIEENAYIGWTKIEKPAEVQKSTLDFGESVLTFDGETSSMVIKSVDTSETNEITLSAWVKLDADWIRPEAKNDGIIIKTGAGHLLAWDQVRKIKVTFRLGDKNFGVDAKNINFSTDEWHFIAGTFDGKTIKLFVDGELVNSLEKDGTLSASDEGTYVGSDMGTGKFFKGEIDEVDVQNNALSETEIMNLFKSKM